MRNLAAAKEAFKNSYISYIDLVRSGHNLADGRTKRTSQAALRKLFPEIWKLTQCNRYWKLVQRFVHHQFIE